MSFGKILLLIQKKLGLKLCISKDVIHKILKEEKMYSYHYQPSKTSWIRCRGSSTIL